MGLATVHTPEVTERRLRRPNDRGQVGTNDAAARHTHMGRPRRRISPIGSGHCCREVLVYRGQELLGGQPGLVGADQQREVLGHLALFDGLHADAFEGLGERRHLGGAVKLAAVLDATGPRVDRGDRVGGGRLAELVLAEVSGHRAVRSLGLDGLAVGGHQHRGHQAERAVSLRDGVGLDVTVVVLAGPDVSALPLHARSHHVVDQPVLVGQTGSVVRLLELLVEDLLEDVLEGAVISLEDGVLGREVDRVLALQAVVQLRTGEVLDGLVEVVHPHDDAAIDRDVHNLHLDGLIGGCIRRVPGDRDLARAGNLEVGCLVLVAEGVTADDDRLGPAWHQPRDVAAEDRLAEDGAAEDVADGAIGRGPHLLEAELLDACLVGGDRRALDPNAVLLDGVRGVDRDLVVGLVALLARQVVVLEVDVQIGVDQAVLDELPDDPRHLITIELDDGVLHLDLAHACGSSVRPLVASRHWRKNTLTSRYFGFGLRTSAAQRLARLTGDRISGAIPRAYGALLTSTGIHTLRPKGHSIVSTSPIKVAVTGAAGQIGYSLLFHIASGALFGPEVPVELRLLEITPALKTLEGVVMELDDCAFPTLAGIQMGDDPNTIFEGVNLALLVGARPRGPGMERNDLLAANGAIFTGQGKALNDHAADDVHITVTGNPANTNALIAMSNAPDIPRERFSALTRLDHNRALAQLAAKAGVSVNDIRRMTIWGNHSATQYPDIFHAEVNGQNAAQLVNDQAWLEGDFIPTVQKRGAA